MKKEAVASLLTASLDFYTINENPLYTIFPHRYFRYFINKKSLPTD
ncbi:hypothetical protein BSM4216_3486 [Bacillus smithii]|nr:hypothetical protein BSM4216_3486 [Bacillus smithii]